MILLPILDVPFSSANLYAITQKLFFFSVLSSMLFLRNKSLIFSLKAFFIADKTMYSLAGILILNHSM